MHWDEVGNESESGEKKGIGRRGDSRNVGKDEEEQAAIASTIVDCMCKTY